MTVATRTGGVALEAAIASYRNVRRTELSEQTLDRMYMPRLNAFAVWVRAQEMPLTVGGLTREHVSMYIEWLQNTARSREGAGGQKSATVTYRTLRTFFNWLVAEDEIRRSPMERMKPPKVTEEAPQVLTDAQLARLYKACNGRGFEARRDAALMRVLADSGMRRGEVAGLTVADVHLDGAGLILLRGETSKGNRDRIVPLSKEAVAVLDRPTSASGPDTRTPRFRGSGSGSLDGCPTRASSRWSRRVGGRPVCPGSTRTASATPSRTEVSEEACLPRRSWPSAAGRTGHAGPVWVVSRSPAGRRGVPTGVRPCWHLIWRRTMLAWNRFSGYFWGS